jgi:phenylacetate-CoA ligase
MSSHEKSVNKYIHELAKYHRLNNGYDFTKIRNKLLTELLVYARKHSPYYRRILASIDIKNVKSIIEIPFLTKDIIRQYRESIKSKIAPSNLLYNRKTGGSTGEPLAFWSIGNTEMLHQSFLFCAFGYCDGDKILAMDGSLIDDYLLKQNVFWKIKNDGIVLPYGGMTLSSLYLNNDNIELYIGFIKSYKPDFIRGYPSFISEIARYILDKNISLDFKLKGVEVTSELCLESQANNIRQAFKTIVFGQYGHSEASIFGYTINESFVYFCSPLYGFTEVIRDDGHNVEIGEEGEIIVTGFSSFGFPFIRYRTGDRAIYGGDENGIVILNKILGRSADYLVNWNNEKVLLTALIFGQHFDAFSKIKRWQFIQNQTGIVNVLIDKGHGYSYIDENEIAKFFFDVGKIKTNFQYDLGFVKTKAGKTKFVIQNIEL